MLNYFLISSCPDSSAKNYICKHPYIGDTHDYLFSLCSLFSSVVKHVGVRKWKVYLALQGHTDLFERPGVVNHMEDASW